MRSFADVLWAFPGAAVITGLVAPAYYYAWLCIISFSVWSFTCGLFIQRTWRHIRNVLVHLICVYRKFRRSGSDVAATSAVNQRHNINCGVLWLFEPGTSVRVKQKWEPEQLYDNTPLMGALGIQVMLTRTFFDCPRLNKDIWNF